MFKTILVPVDGSPLAERVLPYAIRLARAPDAKLVLVRAHRFTAPVAFVDGPLLPGPLTEAEEREQAEAWAELRATADRVRTEGVALETHLYEGPAAEVILAAAQATQADLIAMSTHGRSGLGRWLYGSVADEVLRTAARPLLLVSAHVDHQWPAQGGLRVLVPLDRSPLAREALGPAGELVAAVGGEILLLGVVEPIIAASGEAVLVEPSDPQVEEASLRTYLDTLAEPLRAAGRAVSVRVATGAVAGTIVRLAEQEHADVIAMATHGLSGLARLVLGSVASGTLQRSGVPLLLLRPAGLGAAGMASGGTPAEQAEA
jgi:nucleotide-binding universal stress UspA family protein